MKDYKAAVFIGRFQPFHKSHEEVVRQGLEIAEKVIVIVGSSGAARNIKNPFTFEERKAMIQSCFGANDPVAVEANRDYHYNDNTWVQAVQNIVGRHVSDGDTVALLGNYKDGSSYYLKYFPQWEFVPAKASKAMNATDVRDALFDVQYTTSWKDTGEQLHVKGSTNKHLSLLPAPVLDRVMQFKQGPYYKDLIDEWQFIKSYKKKWETAPFPPTFVTTDAIVVCSGHILVVRRKFNPGKGLLALPGGFIRQGEKIENAAIRELREETGIKVDKLILHSNIVDRNVFDHPSRSLRGRTITHGFHIKLRDGSLPELRAGDDAAEAQWMPLMDVGKYEDQFYEDHAHIIHYFVNKG